MGGANRYNGFATEIITLQKGTDDSWRLPPPYCVPKLIQFLSGCYRFYIYLKCPKINTFQNGRCTHTWAAIVFRIEITALLIFHGVKFNDSLFLRGFIVIFCTQGIIAILITYITRLNLTIKQISLFPSTIH